jgi:MFS family permease
LSFATSGWQVIVWRLAWGIAEGATVPPLYQLCVTSASLPAEKSARVIGWFGSAAVLGMAAGPGFVGLLHDVVGFRGFFRLAAIFSAVGAVLIAVLLRPHGESSEEMATDERETSTEALPSPVTSLLVLVAVCGLADLLNNFLYSALEPILPLYAVAHFGHAVSLVSLLFFLGLLTFAAVSAPAGRILDRLGAWRLSATAFLIAAGGIALQAAIVTPSLLIAGFIVFMVSQPLVYVAVRQVIAANAAGRRGRAFGFLGLISDGGYVLGPVVGAPLFAATGRTAFAVLAAAAALGAAVSYAVDRVAAPGRRLRRVPEPAP